VSEAPALAPPTLYERAAALVEQLFEAPADPRCWNRMLKALCRELSEDAVAMVIGQITPSGPAFLIGNSLGMKRVSDLVQPRRYPPSGVMPAGTVFPIPPADAGFERTHLFQNCLRRGYRRFCVGSVEARRILASCSCCPAIRAGHAAGRPLLLELLAPI
jgi:hypothetical protein